MNNLDGILLLTHREEEVVRLVACGMKNREIAEALHVKVRSVRNYIYRIFEKLGVSLGCGFYSAHGFETAESRFFPRTTEALMTPPYRAPTTPKLDTSCPVR
jgi:DNA-binding NarL/FixJ family response regulator